jgi:hypothetical protein
MGLFGLIGEVLGEVADVVEVAAGDIGGLVEDAGVIAEEVLAPLAGALFNSACALSVIAIWTVW